VTTKIILSFIGPSCGQAGQNVGQGFGIAAGPIAARLSNNVSPRDAELRQRQDLKLATVKSNQAFVDQTVARLDVIINGELEQLADFIVAVKAQPIAIRRQHQEKIQQIFVVAERDQKAIEQEAPVNPGKGWYQHPLALGQDQSFREHRDLDQVDGEDEFMV
jgi:hypothetical protein